jgi:uncharacterized protein (DUF983 family)
MPKVSTGAKIMFRSCPRCNGDLYIDMLEIEEEFVCIQCGRRMDRAHIAKIGVGEGVAVRAA